MFSVPRTWYCINANHFASQSHIFWYQGIEAVASNPLTITNTNGVLFYVVSVWQCIRRRQGSTAEQDAPCEKEGKDSGGFRGFQIGSQVEKVSDFGCALSAYHGMFPVSFLPCLSRAIWPFPSRICSVKELCYGTFLLVLSGSLLYAVVNGRLVPLDIPLQLGHRWCGKVVVQIGMKIAILVGGHCHISQWM